VKESISRSLERLAGAEINAAPRMTSAPSSSVNQSERVTSTCGCTGLKTENNEKSVAMRRLRKGAHHPETFAADTVRASPEHAEKVE